MGTKNLNSGVHDCIASILLIDLSPYPLIEFFVMGAINFFLNSFDECQVNFFY